MTNTQNLTAKMEELLAPCPFCGYKATIFGAENGGFRVGCDNQDCGATLPAWLDFEKDEPVLEKIALAIEYWNTRKEVKTDKTEEILEDAFRLIKLSISCFDEDSLDILHDEAKALLKKWENPKTGA